MNLLNDFDFKNAHRLRRANFVLEHTDLNATFSTEHLVELCGQRVHAFNRALHLCFDKIESRIDYRNGVGKRYKANPKHFAVLRRLVQAANKAKE